MVGSWQGNSMVGVNRSLTQQGNSMGTAGEEHGNGMVCVNHPLTGHKMHVSFPPATSIWEFCPSDRYLVSCACGE
jgi:hypothetical protein